jgi:hypothetical protein
MAVKLGAVASLLCFHVPLVVPQGDAANKSRASAVSRPLGLYWAADRLRQFLDIPPLFSLERV